jgi:hypothetical protein
MNFSEMLTQFIGKTIEVFQLNQLIEGKLISVANGSFIVEISQPPYLTPTTQMTITNSSVQMARILMNI